MKSMLLGSIGAALVLSACPGGALTLEEEGSAFATPRSEVPAALQGDWFVGSLSTLQYYDRATGQWAEPSGSGFYLILQPGGLYEHGAVITSTFASGGTSCTARLLGSERGTVVVQGGALTLHRNNGKAKVTNDCGGDGENDLGPETTTFAWTLETDDGGTEWLVLDSPELTARYRRWK